ncbi:hypothetical protein TEA_012575 [Camellia sinensis var. sinensis]|uniref:Uncharacterized protein n=1 Tax=Camellia sinensis var. sinensis TaxID=542762 RepID=A0A4S4EPH7_CAMSN|nr:hypothetical protein TEA_012575 [Camellia sinensis var. sinensis]
MTERSNALRNNIMKAAIFVELLNKDKDDSFTNVLLLQRIWCVTNLLSGSIIRAVYLGIHSRIGFVNLLPDGFSWTLLRYIHGDQRVHSAQRLVALKAECNSKLAVALTIMEECFLSMVDSRTGIDMIPHVLYNWGTDDMCEMTHKRQTNIIDHTATAGTADPEVATDYVEADPPRYASPLRSDMVSASDKGCRQDSRAKKELQTLEPKMKLVRNARRKKSHKHNKPRTSLPQDLTIENDGALVHVSIAWDQEGVGDFCSQVPSTYPT